MATLKSITESLLSLIYGKGGEILIVLCLRSKFAESWRFNFCIAWIWNATSSFLEQRTYIFLDMSIQPIVDKLMHDGAQSSSIFCM